MDKARALVLEKPRTLSLRTYELPEIHDDDALLRIEACGLCGTDHEQYTGAIPSGFEFVPGHESVGILEEIGPNAAKNWGVGQGDRVAVEVFQSCHQCPNCTSGNYRQCSSHGIGDMYGFIPVSKEPSLWGGYASHQYLSPDSIVHKVPDGLDPVVATLFNPLGAGIRWGSTIPQVAPGEIVVILGPGIRGICAVVAAKLAGASFIAITGKGPRDKSRLDTASRFGADLAIDIDEIDPDKALTSACGTLADVVVNVTAKAPSAIGQAIKLVRPGGRIVMAGTSGSPETPGLWPDLIVYKEITIFGALGVDSVSYRKALEILADQSFPFQELDRKTAQLESAGNLILEMAGETGSTPPIHGVLLPHL